MKKLLFSLLFIVWPSIHAMEQPQASAFPEQTSETHVLPPIEYLFQYCSNGDSADQSAPAVDQTAQQQPQPMQGGAPAQCPECGRNCVTQAGLKRHLKYHAPDRPHKCPYADYASKKKCHLDDHILAKHNGAKSFKCTFEGCTHAFKTAGGLRNHKYRHDPKFQCHCCKKKFSTKQQLRNHEVSHEEERPFECPHEGCWRAFKTQASLGRHLVIHEPQRPHVCPVVSCSQGFNELDHLYRHIQSKHSESNPRLFIQKCQQAATAKVLLNLDIQAQQPTQPTPDERISIASLLNPLDQTQNQSDNLLHT